MMKKLKNDVVYYLNHLKELEFEVDKSVDKLLCIIHSVAHKNEKTLCMNVCNLKYAKKLSNNEIILLLGISRNKLNACLNKFENEIRLESFKQGLINPLRKDYDGKLN